VCEAGDQDGDVADLKRGRFREFEAVPLRGSKVTKFHASTRCEGTTVTSFGEKHRPADFDLGCPDFSSGAKVWSSSPSKRVTRVRIPPSL
jgi:hypothetical protein